MLEVTFCESLTHLVGPYVVCPSCCSDMGDHIFQACVAVYVVDNTGELRTNSFSVFALNLWARVPWTYPLPTVFLLATLTYYPSFLLILS